MEYNIINTYINYLKREYLEFFKIILKDKYIKRICEKFLNRYIEVRYYNETNYPREKDILNRLNKELLDVYETIDNKDDTLKNIVALFGYIVYFDDVYTDFYDGKLLESLVKDETIKINDRKNLKPEIQRWYINLKRLKFDFFNMISSKEWTLSEKSVYRKTYEVDLLHNIKISNLYSEYAIDKAYNNSGLKEDKLFIIGIYVSTTILNNALTLDFSRHYVIELPKSLIKKEKKFERFLNVFNNSLAKKQIIIKIDYTTYLENIDVINRKIKSGYSFGLVIDSKYEGNLDELILFPYVFVPEEHDLFDTIINEKNKINSKIVKI